MAFKQFNHLNIPEYWERYFTKYPQGMTILESLFEWVSQVDSMVDNQNSLNSVVNSYGNRLDEFITRFDPRLQEEVTKTLTDWQNSGLLANLINAVLKTQMNVLTVKLEETELKKLNRNENESITKAMLSQEVKEDLNNGVIEFKLNTSEIEDEAVSPQKIATEGFSVNVFNKDSAVSGSYFTGYVGSPAALTSSPNWYGNHSRMPVKAGDVVRFNQAYMNGYYIGVDGNNTILQNATASISPAGSASIVVKEGVVGFYTAVFKDHIDSFMITVNNQMPSSYTPHKLYKQLEWLELTEKSVTEEQLSDIVKEKLNGAKGHKYVSSDGVIAGDSIVSNTGQNPTGNELLIGYDGVLSRLLKTNSIQNIGFSGKPMASESTAGVGTYETVISSSLNWLEKHWFSCNAGTNDFKLNVPLGSIKPIGSEFDLTTYVGAYQATIEYLLGKNSDLEIVIMTPAQRNNSGYTTESTNAVGHKLIDYVNAGKEIAEKYSAVLADIYGESGIREITIGKDTYDGLHLNNSGYEKGGTTTANKMIYG